MSLQFATEVRNAMLDAFEFSVGKNPVLRIFTGAKPKDCTKADSGTKIFEIILPDRWMADAANGEKTIAGPWTGLGLPAAKEGTGAGHFRIYDHKGHCRIQGLCGRGPGELSLDNLSIASGQNVDVDGFTISLGHS